MSEASNLNEGCLRGNITDWLERRRSFGDMDLVLDELDSVQQFSCKLVSRRNSVMQRASVLHWHGRVNTGRVSRRPITATMWEALETCSRLWLDVDVTRLAMNLSHELRNYKLFIYLVNLSLGASEIDAPRRSSCLPLE